MFKFSYMALAFGLTVCLFTACAIGKQRAGLENKASKQGERTLLSKCQSASDLDLTECSGHKIEILQQELNQLYTELEKLAGKYDKQPIQDLKDARHAWDVYILKECEFESDDVYHHSAQNSHRAWCIESETRQRIVKVKELIHNFKERS